MAAATNSARTASPEVILAVRLMQIQAFTMDEESTIGAHDRTAKQEFLRQLVRATTAVALAYPAGLTRRLLSGLPADDQLLDTISLCAVAIRPRLTPSDLVTCVVELATATNWPPDVSWTTDRASRLADATSLIGLSLTRPDIDRLNTKLRRARRRLQKDSIAPGTQATLGGAYVAASLAAPGVADAVGGFIGAQLFGLSGAAATSAGLAFLGGGTGGLGMAGGTFLISRATHSAARGAVSLAGHLAMSAPAAFIEELARLDVAVDWASDELNDVVAGLESLQGALQKQIDAMRPPELRRRRLKNAAGLLTCTVPVNGVSPFRVVHRFRDDLPGADERHLAKSLRAVDHELRHLRSPEWQRRVQAVPRYGGFPSANRLFDKI